jgi:hypothetical protein
MNNPPQDSDAENVEKSIDQKIEEIESIRKMTSQEMVEFMMKNMRCVNYGDNILKD